MTRKKSPSRPPKLDAPTGSKKPLLKPEDVALWHNTVAAARPLKRNVRQTALPKVRMAVRTTAEAPAHLFTRQKKLLPLDSATLDKTWDRKTRLGELVPDMIIDLHGHTVKQAHGVLERGLVGAVARQARVVLIITGKGQLGVEPPKTRGVLRDSLAAWLEAPELRLYLAALRPAHTKHGGAGAFYAILRRQKLQHQYS